MDNCFRVVEARLVKPASVISISQLIPRHTSELGNFSFTVTKIMEGKIKLKIIEEKIKLVQQAMCHVLNIVISPDISHQFCLPA